MVPPGTGTSNKRPRWGRGGWVMRCYKHTAPLGPGRLGDAMLQTYGPAGAGPVGWCAATNIRPRWGRVDKNLSPFFHN